MHVGSPILHCCETHAFWSHVVLSKVSSHHPVGCCRESDLLAELQGLSQGHSDALSAHHTGGPPPCDCSHTSTTWPGLAILLLLLQRLQLGLQVKQGPQSWRISELRREF